VKAGGNRRVQPIVDKFFYWLRASALENNRVADWWAGRMLTSPRPFQAKMALLWHGHFVSNVSLFKDFRIAERLKLQITSEVFNALKR
jgi:hypothetical protein